MKSKKVIGVTDHVDLVEFGFKDVPCKIDTGALTSSLHCEKIRLIEKDGKDAISFVILDKSHPQYSGQAIRMHSFVEKKVRNSFGNYEYRFEIKTRIRIFGKVYSIPFTLSNREKMKFPLLLGSKFLKNKFIVDVAEKDLSFGEKGKPTSSKTVQKMTVV